VSGVCSLQCFDFDKFEPYESEEDLVAASLNYVEDQKLWAGTMYLHLQGCVMFILQLQSCINIYSSAQTSLYGYVVGYGIVISANH